MEDTKRERRYCRYRRIVEKNSKGKVEEKLSCNALVTETIAMH